MKNWNYFTTNEIKPCGWLKRQLEIQAEGLCGNLDKIWRDVRDSAWIGGNGDNWERVPCWLDGFVPLAYLLENEDMIARAKRYIDIIIERQREDGWICPCKEEEIVTYDTWAIQLMSKTLTVYYECSKDERIPNVIYKMLKNYYDLLSLGKVKLGNSWGKFRWFECLIAINFLWKRTGEAWLKDLAKILKEQGVTPEEMILYWKTPLAHPRLESHIVNIALFLKYEAVSYEILGEEYKNNAEYLYNVLKNYNGTPVGLFTGDEHLAGLSPNNGTELCAVVEQMYTFEHLFATTGDVKWLERLEVLAFNALPATLSDDMWAHQYVQLSNQISCIRFPHTQHSVFTTNHSDAHIFGLEPNFGCCTVNHSHGFPKLALSTFAYNGDTVMNTLPIPAKLSTENCEVEVITEYPFKNKFLYKVKAKKNFIFKVRIPSFAKNLTVDSHESDLRILTFTLKAGEEREINVSFNVDVELVERPHDLRSVKRGSLVFSLPIAYEKKMYEYELDGVERKYPYCDYEYVGKSDWNYGFSDVCFECEEREIDKYPFSSEKPAIVLKAKMKKIPWGKERFFEDVCAMIPSSREPISGEEEKELYPYGSAKLRMTEMPLVD